MRTNLFIRLAPVAAVAMFAATASAQDIVSNGVSVAGEKNNHGVTKQDSRAAIFTQSAFVAPKGAFGLGVQAIGQRASSDESGVDVSATASIMAVSAFYGVTDRLSLGAYVPYARMGLEIDGDGASESGLADAGLFARFAAYQSGSTRFSLGAEMTMPTGDSLFTMDDPTYGLNAAMSRSAGKWNFHVAPSLQFVKNFDAGINLNAAAVRSMSDKLSWSGEVLSQFGGAPSDIDGAEGAQEIDLASGLRYRFAGRTIVDFGLRYNVASQLDPKPTTTGAYVGLNWAF
jgi:hypothetical protein